VDQIGDFKGGEFVSFDAVVQGAEGTVHSGMVTVNEEANLVEGEAGSIAEEPGEDLPGKDNGSGARGGFEDADGDVAAEANERDSALKEGELVDGHKTQRREGRRDFKGVMRDA
jgi:hypothetical protein